MATATAHPAAATHAATGAATYEILVHNISHSDAILALAAGAVGIGRSEGDISGSSNSNNNSSYGGSGGGGVRGEVLLARPKFFSFAPVTRALLDAATTARASAPTPVLTRDDRAPTHPLSFGGGGGSGVGAGVGAGAGAGAGSRRQSLPVGLRLDPPCRLPRALARAAADAAGPDAALAAPGFAAGAAAGRALASLPEILSFRQDDFRLLQEAVFKKKERNKEKKRDR
jgi:hypothetical protein